MRRLAAIVGDPASGAYHNASLAAELLRDAAGVSRDVLSRLIYGTRIALTVAFVAAILACLLGTTLGLLAGYYRGWIDSGVSRLIDIWMAFPPVLLSIRFRIFLCALPTNRSLRLLSPESCPPVST
jgi:ABC-type dipeptide/oligopeptide/nickel transport system permease subunit